MTSEGISCKPHSIRKVKNYLIVANKFFFHCYLRCSCNKSHHGHKIASHCYRKKIVKYWTHAALLNVVRFFYSFFYCCSSTIPFVSLFAIYFSGLRFVVENRVNCESRKKSKLFFSSLRQLFDVRIGNGWTHFFFFHSIVAWVNAAKRQLVDKLLEIKKIDRKSYPVSAYFYASAVYTIVPHTQLPFTAQQ